MIEKWEAPLDRITHQHPVSLRVQQVAGEERDDLEVLRTAEGTRAAEVCREARAHAVEWVAGGARSAERVGLEKAERTRGVVEAKAVAVQRVIRVGESGAEDVRQHPARASEVLGEIRVQATQELRSGLRVRLTGPESTHLVELEHV